MAINTNDVQLVDLDGDNTSDMVIILENARGRKTRTFKEYFEYYGGMSQILPCSAIKNWGDVVDNIKDKSMKDDAIMNGCLFGPEYPPDTPITGG
jgi:hypothetical protein